MKKKNLIGSLIEFLAPWSSALLGTSLPSDLIASIASNIASRMIEDLIREQLTFYQVKDISDRAKEAASQLENAGKIIQDLQKELHTRGLELDQLMELITDRKNEAIHWANQATKSEELAKSFNRELEIRIREQLRAELDRGKRKRQVLGMVIWVITLIAGAVAGVVAQQWWQTKILIP
jgi:hypothetical protein